MPHSQLRTSTVQKQNAKLWLAAQVCGAKKLEERMPISHGEAKTWQSAFSAFVSLLGIRTRRIGCKSNYHAARFLDWMLLLCLLEVVQRIFLA